MTENRQAFDQPSGKTAKGGGRLYSRNFLGGEALFRTFQEEEPWPSTNQQATTRARGAVRKRFQLETKAMGEKHWTKRSKASGQFMDQKDKGKFKGVRKEK